MVRGDNRFPAIVLATLAALFLAALLLFAALATLIAWKGPPPASAEAQRIPGRSLHPILGRGVAQGDALAITGYRERDGSYHAIAVWRGAVAAADFSLLRLDAVTAIPAPELNLTWRTASAPSEVHAAPLLRGAPGPPVLDLSALPDWRDTVVEIGIHAVAHRADAPLVIESLGLQTASWHTRAVYELSRWVAFRGWLQTSINFLHGTPASAGISPVPVAAAWGALACLLLLLYRLVGTPPPAAFAGAVLVPWLCLDGLWQKELVYQLYETRVQFAGKSMHEKHLSDEDAPVYAYATRLRSSVLPTEPQRIFILHPNWGHHYDRLKIQYYLLPHNVFNFGKGPQGQMRPGDYLLLLEGLHDPRYDPASGTLDWRRGERLSVERIDRSPMGTLYKVLGDAAA